MCSLTSATSGVRGKWPKWPGARQSLSGIWYLPVTIWKSCCERGDLDARGLYDIFCKQTKTAADFDLLERAGCDIFELNLAIVPLISHLRSAGNRLGILSNTSGSHWKFVTDGR